MTKQKGITIKETIIQGMTSGTAANALFLSGNIPEEYQLFYNLGIGAIGATAAVLNTVNLNGKELIIESEVEKVQLAIESIKEIMDKNEIKTLKNYLTVRTNPALYQFIKNIFNEAVEAKTEKMRSYCASCIVWVGEADFSKDIDFRKLYKTLSILQQLDDLDFEILECYDTYLQFLYSNEKVLYTEFEVRKLQLLENRSYSSREIDVSLKKMASLALLPNHSHIAVYEDKQTKAKIIDTITLTVLGENSPYNVTSIYYDFNRYVHTYL
jgi:hypothetical protein